MKTYALAFVAAALCFIYPLTHPYDSLGHDWEYFASLSWVVYSNVLGNWSFHDPWACGGVDLLANPQARVWSPLGLLDVLLAPHQAHVVSWLIYALFGVVGAYRLCREYAGALAAAGAALVWINTAYFALHFAQGHSTFAALQLLPWAAVFARRRDLSALCVLLALLIADGAFYAVIFCVYAFASSLSWRAAPERPAPAAIAALALFALAKIGPALLLQARSESQCAHEQIDLMQALFAPRLEPHEAGAYVGLALLTLMAMPRQAPRVLFWLWVASGLGGVLNPWTAHCALPFFNVAHVQARTLILAVVMLLPAIATAMQRWRWVGLVLVIEAISVRQGLTWKAYDTFTTNVLPHSAIAKTQWTETVDWGAKPEIYQREGITSRTCYEPSVTRALVDVGPPGAKVKRLVPGEITLEDVEGEITLNMASLGGWTGAEMLPGERVRFRTEKKDTLTLRYAPRYRWWLWPCVVLGYLSIHSWWRSWRPAARLATARPTGTPRSGSR